MSSDLTFISLESNNTSTQKMEAAAKSEMMLKIHHTTWWDILQDR
jgi:hypothetical protein